MMIFSEIKDLPKYLKTEILLMGISLFSLTEIISMHVYQKQFFNVYQLFCSDPKLITLTIVMFIVGLKFLTPSLKIIWMLIHAIYLEYGPNISTDDYKDNRLWKYNQKVRDGKKFALMHNNDAIIKIYEKAEGQAKRDEFIGQLTLWNIFSIVIVFLDFYFLPKGFTEAPFYYQIFEYINHSKQTIHQPLFEIVIYISILAIIFKTYSYAWLYLKNEDFFFIPYDEMSIIEDIMNTAKYKS